MTDLKIEYVPAESIKVHPENPRQGDVAVIEQSIQRNGVYQPVVVQRSTGFIVVGNHRYLAMRNRGIDQIPVIWRDVDDQAAHRIMLADNRTSELGDYDSEQLVALLEGLGGDLDGTGYTEDRLDDLLAYVNAIRLSEYQPESDGEDSEVGSVSVWEGHSEVVVVYDAGAREALYAALHDLEFVINVRDKTAK